MRRFFKNVILIFLPILILISTFTFFINREVQKNILTDLTTNLQELNNREVDHLYEYLYPVFLDTYFLASNVKNEGSNYREILVPLQQEFFIFSNASKYDQIRILDTMGHEIIRVDYDENEAILIPQDSLQDKSHRDYFDSARHLNKDQIYISRIDLNKEFRQLELPYQPVIRFVKPMTDKTEKINGYLVINCDSKNLIEPDNSKEYQTFLFNQQGYWLNNNKIAPSFAFEFDSLKNLKASNLYTEAWQHIQNNEKGYLRNHNGLFVFQKITFDPLVDRINQSKGINISTLNPSTIYLVKYINNIRLQSQLSLHYPTLIIGSIAAILLALSIWITIINKQVENRDVKLKEKVYDLQHKEKILTLKNTQLESFIRIASHDLREPLASIKSVAKSLEEYDGKTTDKFYSRYLNFIVSCTDRMDRLTRGVLDYAVTGRSSKLEPVDLNMLMEAIKEDLTHSILHSNATIIADQLPPVVNCYKMEIKQVFQNLISNAIKYSQDDKPPVIQIAYSEDSDFHTFQIIDNGIGISEQDVSKIFQMFKRLEVKRTEDGLGIGLAITKKIVELHLGEIWIETNQYEGSTFSFTISKHLGN